MEVPEPDRCSVCDFDFDPYHKVVLVLRLTIGGDGKWRIDGMEAIHAHCWSNHVTLAERHP